MVWIIIQKDLRVRLRDWGSIFFTLAGPVILLLIIALAFATGDSRQASNAIPIIIVNQDDGVLGVVAIKFLETEREGVLLQVNQSTDLEEAQQRVETGQADSVIYLHPKFTEYLMQSKETSSDVQDAKLVSLYVNPAKSASANLVQQKVHRAISEIVGSILQFRLQSTETLSAEIVAAQWKTQVGEPASVVDKYRDDLIQIQEKDASPNPLSFFAPSMAIFFLMFGMLDGTRSILAEHSEGTLMRLFGTPAGMVSILLGKLASSFLMGVLQFIVLILASQWIFQLSWGNSLAALGIMVLALVMAMTSLGSAIAAFSRDVAQANMVGGTLALVFAVLGGNFIPASSLPQWLQIFSRLTINWWGLEGLSDLTMRGLGLAAVLPKAGILLLIAFLAFALAIFQFNRRFVR